MEKKDATSQINECAILFCHICGDKARGMNFNAISCMSCKMFFRRNALRHRVSMFICFPTDHLNRLNRIHCDVHEILVVI